MSTASENFARMFHELWLTGTYELFDALGQVVDEG